MAPSADPIPEGMGPSRAAEPIAIVGLSCKFGGEASTPSKFWDMIAAGRDGWSAVPQTRFDAGSLYHPDGHRTGRHPVKGGYFIEDDIHAFDAAFFNLTADAANMMDPQLTLLMESVYEALENAGLPLSKLVGSRTSVYTATFGRDNADMMVKDPETLSNMFITGNGTAMYSNRISHFYDLRGPSVTIDTGCSGSLASIHLAVQNLRSSESETSIVAGSGLLQNPDYFIALSGAGVLSSEGRCYSWDHRACGYGRGEGISTIILKRLSTAIKDGDSIHAVIRETAMNQDGKTGTITSPSAAAQREVIEQCYRRAGLDMSSIGYVEAHMTGTGGDPIEAESIGTTLGLARERGDTLYVGSVKTNVGHTEAVSGLASVIKTCFALKHQLIPPNLNYEKGHPDIPLEDWNLTVPTECVPWPVNKPLRASINNFGYGGTNVHLILEAAPGTMRGLPNGSVHGESYVQGTNGINRINGVNASNGPKSKPYDTIDNGHSATTEPASLVFILSSKDPTGLVDTAKRMFAFVKEKVGGGDQAPSLQQLACTLNERRSRFEWISALRARSLDDLAARLENFDRKPVRAISTSPRIGFVFSGQGAQWFAMGRELLSTYPIFRMSVDRAERCLCEIYGASWKFTEELLRDQQTTRVHNIELGQPVTVALQLCLVDLLSSWSITASAVVSHSSGEIAAAYAAGILSFEEAVGVAYFRGLIAAKFQAQTPTSGGMAAVGLSAEEAESYIAGLEKGKVVIACINSPNSVTLSGDLPALDEVLERLEGDDVFARRLKVPMAYHSHQMEAMAEEYRDALSRILPVQSRMPQVRYSSPVTGKLMSSSCFGPEHWVANLTSPVLFSQALINMVLDNEPSASTTISTDILVEIGAHDTLSGAARQTLKDVKIPYFSCLKRPTNAVDTMQDLACELIMLGFPVVTSEVNNSKLAQEDDCKRVLHDLPLYSWNHSSSYKFEPRLSKENRYKPFPPHELLGTSVAGSIKQYPTWRNYLRIQDVPWLIDHRLQSEVVLPGAGYVTMAIEAVRMVESACIPLGSVISGYRLQNVDIMNALVVPPSTTGIETLFSLRPSAERELDHTGWYDFEVWSVTAASAWTQHARGRVMADIRKDNNQTGTASLARLDSALSEAGAKFEVIEPEEIYSSMRGMDFHHGPAFQNLKHCRVSNTTSVTDMGLSRDAIESGNVLHPTTLDSVFQACYGCLPTEAKSGSMFIPRSIGSMVVPAVTGVSSPYQLLASTRLTGIGKREACFSVSVEANDEECRHGQRIEISAFQLQRIQHSVKDQKSESNIYSKVVWAPDVLHDIPAAMKEGMRFWLTNDELNFQARLREACYHLIRDAWKQLWNHSDEDREWHHKKFVHWMGQLIKSADNGELEPGSQIWEKRSDESKELLFQSVSAENVAGELPVKVGRRLIDIIQGHITPLDLMMEDGLLHKHYEAVLETGWLRCLRTQFRQLMQNFIVKHPGARVLEIGAGTGSATRYALEALADTNTHGGCLLAQYDFTDISSGFFEAAKVKFAAYERLMTYSRLDIEADPVEQGFATGSYDLIVAAEVLHATTNLTRTLTNVRSLLKPGGKLMLVESTRGRLDTQLAFGVLPGWWLSEEPYRKDAPVVSVERWNDLLQATGFSGVDFDIGACENVEVNYSSLMLSTATTGPGRFPHVSIVYKRSDNDAIWLQPLADAMSNELGVETALETFEGLSVRPDRLCIMALDIKDSIFQNLTSTDFENLQAVLVNSPNILWLSFGGLVSAEKPQFAQVQGLLRALRREDVAKRCFHLDFDQSSDQDSETIIRNVVHVVRTGFNFEVSQGQMDCEYAVKDGVLHVPRLYPDFKQDQACESDVQTIKVRMPFQTDRTLVWQASDDGLVENAHFVPRPLPNEDGFCSDGVVEIEAKAFGLNFRDVLISMGMLVPANEDHEAAGIVTRLGRGTEQSGLQIGDRVCGNFNGLLANKSQAPWTSVCKIPPEMSYQEAASIPSAFGTAYYSLVTVAGLKPSESVLIHSAAGGVGQAAVMLAQDIGAEVFVTCGGPEKKKLLMDRYKIPGDHIFSSRDESFAPALMAATANKGVDVALNSLAGPLLKATWECMARFGRFVEIGKMDIAASRWLDMSLFRRGLSFTAVDLSQTNVYSPEIMHEVLIACVDLCQRGCVRPVHPITTFSISNIDKAITHMRQGQHMGKLVIVPEEHAEVNVVSKTVPLELSNMSGTIIVVGGLTGVGKAISEWLISRGARNLAIVSRNATSHAHANELLQRAAQHECNLRLYDCDISDETAFLEMRDNVRTNMPSIIGVIQGAMVLNDAVFERMTYNEWQAATKPKIKGTMNLHQHLPNLQFFIMLSSIAGMVGSVSQANYCAGNTFQDALARHRVAHRLPATTIDLGRVQDAGYVAQGDQALLDRLNSTFGTASLPLAHIYRLIEQSIRGTSCKNQQDSHIITCVPSYKSLPDATLRADKRFGTMRLGDQMHASGTASSASSAQARMDDLIRTLNAQATSSIEGAGSEMDTVLALLQAKVADLFNVEETEVDTGLSVASYGVDSLVAVQLRNWLSSAVKANLTIFEILQSSSIKQLAELAGAKSSLVTNKAAAR